MNPQIKQRGVFNFHFLILLGLILFLILMVGYFFYGLQPVSLAEESVDNVADSSSAQFKIVKGEGLREIGASLSQAVLIKSISVFKLYALLSGEAQKFQPGVYELSSTMSVPQIVQILTASSQNDVTVTIPEGLALKDIVNVLINATILETDAISSYPFRSLAVKYPYLAQVNSLEGFLFPDTYRFKRNSGVSEVLGILLDNFQVKAWPLLSDQKNWYDVLTLASILEREVPVFEDRQIVAGILLKRLRKGMPLQADATISYVKCDGAFRNCDSINVIKNDLTLSSPYNTYSRLGFPPTPIANAGQAAIKAALTPKTTPYLYYLSASSTKETYFSKTLEEHNIKRAKYL